ncbi:MAG: helix-turn-helix domain-containing protein, partial [Solirubrobacteraceae bacterium]
MPSTQARKTTNKAPTTTQMAHTPASDVEASLLRGVAQAVAYTRGELNVEPRRVTVTARNAPAVRPAPAVTGDAVKAIRSAYGMSQPVFARILNVSSETVKGWEQGKKRPDGPARRLLEVVRRHPDVVDELTHELVE